LNSRSLIRWSGLEEQRRKQQSGGVQAWSGVVLSILLGSLLAAEIARRLIMASDENLVQVVLGASHLWVAAAICGYAIGVFAAPFRLYWRRDSKLLASLPVPGRSLFALALWRSQRASLLVSLSLTCALLPLGLFTDWQVALRHLLLVGLGFAGSAWLGPAAALSAGAIVASDKAQAMIASMSGEFQAPRTSWLGIMPGVAATALTVTVMACAPWALGHRPPGGSVLLIAALGLGVPALALVWAWSKADEVIPAAVREVAALDQEILAHVERSTPSLIERSFYKLVLGESKAKVLAHKDASLSRRRYPTPYFMIPFGIVLLWIIAGTQPEAYLPWGGSIFGGLVVYTLVMARRTWVAPIEIPQLLHTLPIGAKQIAKSKRAQVLLRLLLVVVLGGVPLILCASEVMSAAILVALSSLLSMVFSMRSDL
jgi:hypothetical protein